MSEKRDYYDVLGLSRDASADEIKRAFRRLAKKYHPDVSKLADADVRFKEVNEAYEILSNPRKRQMYDQFGHAGANQAGAGSGTGGFEDIFSHFSSGMGSNIKDVFSNIFGGGGQQATRHDRAQRGEPLKASVELNLKQVLYGTTVELETKLHRRCEACQGLGARRASDIKTCGACNGHGIVVVQRRTPLGIIETQTTCQRCRGQGKINTNLCSHCQGRKLVWEKRLITIELPRSWPTDQLVRVRGQGHDGVNGGARGDIYLQINVKPHPYFARQGDDLVLELPVTYLDAVLGGEVIAPSFDGNLSVDIPAGTQNNNRFIVSGHGFFKSSHTKRRGNLVIVVKVKIPDRLSRADRALLQNLRNQTDFKIDPTPILKL